MPKKTTKLEPIGESLGPKNYNFLKNKGKRVKIKKLPFP